tara:strand:+ start:343 stop:687 length:345 start_codon:yes stop_codon:yes gene_type:complete
MANVDDLSNKGFGQYGSIFTSVSGAITPPTNKVFIAITFLTDTTLDTAGGLIAEYDGSERKYPTTLDGSSAAVYTQAGGGDAIDVNDTFPKGITIFGRWTEIDIAAGSIIAYIA